jgi:(1->4)-alpha-D-glucan 1-alpha-D-glucosylmutase
LVDPDNRRPVDYLRREQALEDFSTWAESPDTSTIKIKGLLETPEDGRLKLYSIWKTLRLRRQHPNLFQNGEYLPLAVTGAKAKHVVAFVRAFENSTLLVVAPRLVASLLEAGLLDNTNLPLIASHIWGDTRVILPFCNFGARYRNVFTGQLLDSKAEINIAELLGDFTIALCLLDRTP